MHQNLPKLARRQHVVRVELFPHHELELEREGVPNLSAVPALVASVGQAISKAVILSKVKLWPLCRSVECVYSRLGRVLHRLDRTTPLVIVESVGPNLGRLLPCPRNPCLFAPLARFAGSRENFKRVHNEIFQVLPSGFKKQLLIESLCAHIMLYASCFYGMYESKRLTSRNTFCGESQAVTGEWS